MPEFLVLSTVKASGKAYPPFLVPADDERAVRRICKRPWLTIDSVLPFDDKLATEKPRLLSHGPPVSDKSFEDDYHNREADLSPGSKAVGEVRDWFTAKLVRWVAILALALLIALCAGLRSWFR